MVTVVLHCVIKGDKHLFLTNSDGNDLAKSPEGMFQAIEMENDLKAADALIREYWGLAPLSGAKKPAAKEGK